MMISRIAAVSLLALAGCPGRLDDPERFEAVSGLEPDAGAGPCKAETAVFAPVCGSCHNPTLLSGGLDLRSPGVAMRITTGRGMCKPEPLLQLIRSKLTPMPDCGTSMPPGTPLPADEVSCVDAYLTALADGGTF
jgi:hypothetical protein